MNNSESPSFEDLLSSPILASSTRIIGQGPSGRLPFTADMLRSEPSGNLFGLTQNAAMGWPADQTDGEQYLILSTSGGLRSDSGEPLALGYHTGHWELDRLMLRSARAFREHGKIPFAGFCSDPCDGRSQGTTAMFDSLPYRNDAAIVFRRLIRSLPKRVGIMGIATCDKGLPAMLMAVAGCGDLPAVVVPGGVTLPDPTAEDTAVIQTIGARFAQGVISLDYAAEMGCRACGSPGGGCQFLGTAATSQIISEALGLSLPHTALVPSGEPLWEEMAARSALALIRLKELRQPISSLLTANAVENAMLVHAAFGGSTNLLIHLPAIAHSVGLQVPKLEDWKRVNRATPRIVDVLPNGPANYPTSYVFMAGGVPEVMLHLRSMGLLNQNETTATGEPLGSVLDWWADSEYRQACLNSLVEQSGTRATDIIMSPDQARARGLTSTLVFPTGNIAPHGSVVKATAIDPQLVNKNGVYHHRGKARIFTSEHEAITAIKGLTNRPIVEGDVLVLIGLGPTGTGMEEIYQITSALKALPWGNRVPVLTDGRFSGVSTGPCVGHIGPEALADGPISRLRDGDIVEILINRKTLTGEISLVGPDELSTPGEAESLLETRSPHPNLKPHALLPDDTLLWAALQKVSGGPWKGSVFDVKSILRKLDGGTAVSPVESFSTRPDQTARKAQNVEIKVRLQDLSVQRKIARNLTDAVPTIESQRDVFFSVSKGRLKLRYLKGGLGQLIYYDRPDQKGPKTSQYQIFPVVDPDPLQVLLGTALGIRGEVRKTREIYKKGRTRIHLDQVHRLGEFLELEVVLEEDESPESGQAEADELMTLLKVDPELLVETAYIDLLNRDTGAR